MYQTGDVQFLKCLWLQLRDLLELQCFPCPDPHIECRFLTLYFVFFFVFLPSVLIHSLK